MAQWFQCKVKFLRQMDTGLIKRISETYLVDALSFTEAEARILKEVGEGIKEITLMSVTRSNIKEVVFYGDTDLWHKAKVTYVAVDDESETEKKITSYILVNSENVKEAFDRIGEHLKDMMVPFAIPKIEETPVIEVYQYQPGVKASMRSIGLSEVQPGEEVEEEFDMKDFNKGTEEE